MIETSTTSMITEIRKIIFFIDTKTDLLTQKGDYKTAIALLLNQQKIKPTSSVVNTNLANVYIENDQTEKAIPLLEDLIFLDKQDQLAYFLLTEAYRKNGNKAMEHFVKAESLALAADYKTAIDQLNFAYKQSKENPLQLARIEARIRQFRQADRAMESLQ